jgi:hypothetical protein
MVSDKKIFMGISHTKLKIEKRGYEIKKKSSPLKLLSQSQPNFAEMHTNLKGDHPRIISAEFG